MSGGNRELGRLLELLYAARETRRRLFVRVAETVEHEIEHRAERAKFPDSNPTVFYASGEVGVIEEPRKRSAFVETFWSDGSGRWRRELKTDNGASVALASDGRWWSFDDVNGWMAGDDDPSDCALSDVLDPTWLLAHADISPEGATTVAGRDGLAFRALPRRHVRPFDDPFPPGDALLGVADAEVGILLRLDVFFEGERCRAFEMKEVDLDPFIDPAMFAPPDDLNRGEL